jgi:hypothetical protein
MLILPLLSVLCMALTAHACPLKNKMLFVQALESGGVGRKQIPDSRAGVYDVRQACPYNTTRACVYVCCLHDFD